MSYIQRKALSGILDKASGALSAATTILEDPSLPEVTGLVLRLHSLEPPSRPGGPPSKGIGLNKVVKPLRAYVRFREKPWLGYLVLACTFAVPAMLGYAAGKKR
jgi:hypothetical protein